MTSFYGDILLVVRNLGRTDEAVRLTNYGVTSISIDNTDADADADLLWFCVKDDKPGV